MGSNKTTAGSNDLRTWCLNNNRTIILEEWDFENNNGLSPETIAYASKKYVWWICKIGHRYFAKVANRTK